MMTIIMMMMMMMIDLKGAISDLSSSSKCAENCLQHAR